MATTRNKYIIAAIVLLTTAVLYSFGRSIWCPAGDLWPWSFQVWSQHNSQHLLDWYTPSHISHGLIFFIVLQRILPLRLRDYAISIAVALEAGWEILENSPLRRSLSSTVSGRWTAMGPIDANCIAYFRTIDQLGAYRRRCGREATKVGPGRSIAVGRSGPVARPVRARRRVARRPFPALPILRRALHTMKKHVPPDLDSARRVP